MIENYLDKQTTPEARADIRVKMEELEGYMDLALRSVYGALRDSSPWRWDNRLATTSMNMTSLAVQGKIVLTATSDAMHSAMAAGFGTYFRAIWTLLLDDLDRVGKANLDMNGQTGELFDTARTMWTQMAHQMENGRPVVGGTWLENWIARRMPGFFKINGLSSVTVWLKTVMGLAAQHNVMKDSIRIWQILDAGGTPTKGPAAAQRARHQCAAGINIARQPYAARPADDPAGYRQLTGRMWRPCCRAHCHPCGDAAR
jgi:hypothetical protein